MTQARSLDKNNEYIEIEGHRPWAPGATCDSKSISLLQSGEWFNDELINAVSGLVEAPADSQTFLLSSFLYGHLKEGPFSKVDSWVKDLPRTRWAFGSCENDHWAVILIVFEATISILYYDPREDAQKVKNPNHARRMETLEVSFVSLNNHLLLLC